MSMTEKEIQNLYKFWDDNPKVLEEKLGIKVKRKWYQKLWTKILCKVKR